MIVDRDRKDLLGALLSDHIFVENRFDFLRLRQLIVAAIRAVVELLANNIVTEFNALVADEDRRTRNQLANFVLTFATERTVQQLAVVRFAAGFIAHNASFAPKNSVVSDL